MKGRTGVSVVESLTAEVTGVVVVGRAADDVACADMAEMEGVGGADVVEPKNGGITVIGVVVLDGTEVALLDRTYVVLVDKTDVVDWEIGGITAFVVLIVVVLVDGTDIVLVDGADVVLVVGAAIVLVDVLSVELLGRGNTVVIPAAFVATAQPYTSFSTCVPLLKLPTMQACPMPQQEMPAPPKSG